MKRFLVPPHPRAGSARTRGFTLIETMVSAGVLVMVVAGSMYSFMVLNRYAGNLRNLSSAKELCQERIEQVTTLSFSPPSVTPLVPGQDGNYYYILGMPSVLPSVPTGYTTMPTTVPSSSPQASADYNSTGTYTGGSGTTTLTEPVTIYATRDNTSLSGTAVTGTRTTTVTLSPLVDYTSATYLPVTNVSLNLVQFTVTVAYTYHGNAYSYSMYTLRGPD